MTVSMTEMVEKMKMRALGRCQDRILEARDRQKEGDTKKDGGQEEDHGITSHLKKLRGL
jgi:hypothetical protein